MLAMMVLSCSFHESIVRMIGLHGPRKNAIISHLTKFWESRNLDMQPVKTICNVLAAFGCIALISINVSAAETGTKSKSKIYSESEFLQSFSGKSRKVVSCLLYTSPSPRDGLLSR